jgi:hypothetical protein
VDFVIGSTDGYSGGVVGDDGSWTTPSFPYHGDLIPVTCISKADPRQFARGSMQLIEIDADRDTELDALDLGTMAMWWGVPDPPDEAYRVSGVTNETASVSDWDLQFFNEAFLNAWAVPRR